MASTTPTQTGRKDLGRDARNVIFVEVTAEMMRALPNGVFDGTFDTRRALSFGDLDPAILRAEKPDAIIAPLLTSAFDAVELAEYLANEGYDARLIIVSESLPNPQLVTRELKRAAAGVTIQLINLGGDSPVRGV